MARGSRKEKAGKKTSRAPTVDVARKESAKDGRPAQTTETRPQAGPGAAGRAQNEHLLQRQVGNSRRQDAPGSKAGQTADSENTADVE